jgi:hypothetical protein
VLGEELRRQLFACGNDDLVMNAGFVGNDEIAAVAVVEDSNDRGMGPAQDPNHAAFRARRRTGGQAAPSVAAHNASDNPVSVHRIPQLIWRNEEITIEVLPRGIGNDKAIAVAMCD